MLPRRPVTTGLKIPAKLHLVGILVTVSPLWFSELVVRGSKSPKPSQARVVTEEGRQIKGHMAEESPSLSYTAGWRPSLGGRPSLLRWRPMLL